MIRRSVRPQTDKNELGQVVPPVGIRTFIVCLLTNASSDRIGLKRLEINRSTSYRLAYNFLIFRQNLVFQSSYGKDSLTLYVLQDRLSAKETKWESKIGYLNYLHSIDMYWNADPAHRKGIVDVHVNK